MRALDGLYRHAGTTTTWDDLGVTVHRDGRTRRLPWDAIVGVRVRQDGGSYVQLIVADHVSPGDPADDVFSLPVASDPDANRLLMTLGWQAQGNGLTLEELA